MPLKKLLTSIHYRTTMLLTSGGILILFIVVSCSSEKPAAKETRTLAVPQGWYYSRNNSQVDLIKAIEEKKGYRILFERSTESKSSNFYINLAESIYPKRDKILGSASNPSKSWFFERLWWYEIYKDIKIPFAITGDTVNYYVNRYKEEKAGIKQEKKSAEGRGCNLKRLEFVYTAKTIEEGSMVIDGQNLPRIRVVLNMKWYEYCGQPCGWGFEKNREIVFAGKWHIVSISGDGPAFKWTSNQQEPYGPNQWIRF